jgi:pimeloyl-ACP methyl ester carboxylesterase
MPTILICALGTLAITSAAITGLKASANAFDWTALTAAKRLQYVPCYDDFNCTKLEVPLDWSDTSSPERANIAIIRLPALVDTDDDRFGGTVVINPGGPSGSGVGIVLTAGAGLRNVLDSDKHFEILSFDPRGVGFTTPSARCFWDASIRELLSTEFAGVGIIEDNEVALDFKTAGATAIAELCATSSIGKLQDGTNSRQFVSTKLVAQDMVAIVDAVDEHRKRESRTHDGRSMSEQAIIQEEADSALLNYWGLSYGSFLGNTFASMFPNRVGRMILDGVVDADGKSQISSNPEPGEQDPARIPTSPTNYDQLMFLVLA